MQDRHIAAPIFVVGSPRSGTSILTWCLGQHPNILPTEESDWLGPFALQAAVHHAMGSVRGERSQLSALGIERAEFFRGLGDAIDAMILGHRQTLEMLNRAAAQRDPRQVTPEFAVARSDAEPKARWVDGTPEYSLYICGLHQLFPAAKFIHIVRDPDAVAASMLAFRHDDGSPLVTGADEAYAYWERTTRACLLAARALGAEFMLRVRHADLVARSAAALQDMLTFLGEGFAAECVAPLARRINSSFGADAALSRSAPVHSEAAESARRLYAQLMDPVGAMDTHALAEFEAHFAARVDYQAKLDARLHIARARLAEVEREAQAEQRAAAWRSAQQRAMLDACGVLIAVPCLLAWLLYGLGWNGTAPAIVAFAALLSGLTYAWLRRAGLRHLLERTMHGRRRVSGEAASERSGQ